ncbi:hypothetical protein Sjap_013091 [Stephania japonica]|uniref:Uncharacterized protein n=1 Tax=Stephania japonica TaxID=461633 RepID=A0AAP0NYV2_9MAGN
MATDWDVQLKLMHQQTLESMVRREAAYENITRIVLKQRSRTPFALINNCEVKDSIIEAIDEKLHIIVNNTVDSDTVLNEKNSSDLMVTQEIVECKASNVIPKIDAQIIFINEESTIKDGHLYEDVELGLDHVDDAKGIVDLPHTFVISCGFKQFEMPSGLLARMLNE